MRASSGACDDEVEEGADAEHRGASMVSGMPHLHPTTRSVGSSAALGCVLLLGALTACSADSDGDKEPAAYQPTSLSAFDASTVTLERDAFCDDLSEDAVQHTVGEVASTKHYGNGDPVELTDGVEDVSHEFNCTFVGEDGTTARAWVFVPQVTQRRAKELVAAAGKQDRCEQVDGEEFGTPATGRVCGKGKQTEVSYRGLFVDTWLSCSVSGADPQADRDELLAQAGEWCTAAAEAAAADE